MSSGINSFDGRPLLSSVNYNNFLPRSSSEIENPHSFLDTCNNFLVNTLVLHTDSAFLRELFLLKLPANVRMVLASTGDTVSLDKLAELTDKILEVAFPSSIAAVNSSAPQLSTEVSQLREQVTHLHDMVQSFTKRNWTTGRRPKSRSVSPRPPPPPATATLCWYHQKYGDAARRCKPTCDFALNDQTTR